MYIYLCTKKLDIESLSCRRRLEKCPQFLLAMLSTTRKLKVKTLTTMKKRWWWWPYRVRRRAGQKMWRIRSQVFSKQYVCLFPIQLPFLCRLFFSSDVWTNLDSSLFGLLWYNIAPGTQCQVEIRGSLKSVSSTNWPSIIILNIYRWTFR